MTTLEQHSITVLRRLRDAGYEALWAGGCVRDRLIGRKGKDIDIATSASPDDVLALFEHTHEIGKAFGVVQVLVDGSEFEVATFRQDLEYHDGRHPVGYEPSTAKEDAQRRDFTINGLFFDPIKEQLIDHVGGQADIEAKVIRAIGDPVERFREDHLRMLRAIRFAHTLDFEIEAGTFAAIREHAALVKSVSPERVNVELSRTFLEAKKPGKALRCLLDIGLLEHVLPEAIPMDGQEQPPKWHPEGDVFTHVCLMLDLMDERSLELVWSILLHDIAKPPTATETIEPDGSTRIRFNGHAELGAVMAKNIMTRLKFSKAQREHVAHCVATHMKWSSVPEMKNNTLRKIIGGAYFPTELELHRIDCLGSSGDLSHYNALKDFAENYQDAPALPQPLISGGDLIREFGLKPGRQLGEFKQLAYDRQLEDDTQTRETLMIWLGRLLADALDENRRAGRDASEG